MSRNRKWCFLAALLLFFAGMFVYYSHLESCALLGCQLISSDRADDIAAQRQSFPVTDWAGLQLNGTRVPYDAAADIWFIPQDPSSEEWEGSLSIGREDIHLLLLNQPEYGDKAMAIEQNTAFSFIAYNNKYYANGTIIFTGLPAVTLTTEASDEQGDHGTVCVFEPSSLSGYPYEIQQTCAEFHVRGRTSRLLPKQGYKLNLRKKNGSKNNCSLLGMREDDDWILNALYTDPNRVRDKLSIDLWNEINASTPAWDAPGCRMEYVELFINDSYEGIYGLTEPVDYKQLGLDKTQDIIYKVVGWGFPTDEEFAENETSDAFPSVEVKNSDREITASLWEPYQQYVRSMFENTEEAFHEALATYVECDNAICMGLFTDMICGSDNKSKNQYVAAVRMPDGYHFLRVPWDMDLTWGNYYSNSSSTNSLFSMKRSEKSVYDTVFERMLETGRYTDAIRAAWQRLRTDIFTEENISEKIDACTDLLTKSGAFLREEERWPDAGVTAGTDDIKEFAARRLACLDSYYGPAAEDK